MFEQVKKRPKPKEPSAGTKDKNESGTVAKGHKGKAKGIGKSAAKAGPDSKSGLLGWLQRKPS